MMCAVTAQILAVCTGNICRSPAVERLLAARLAGTDIVVGSAGTDAVVGHPVSAPMVPLLADAGGSASGFVARQLTADLVASASLVLALTLRHRSQIVALHPAAVRRTFTLLELARLAPTIDASALPAGPASARLRALVPLAASARRAPQRPSDDEVPDPYLAGDAAYRASFALIAPAVDAIAGLVRPSA